MVIELKYIQILYKTYLKMAFSTMYINEEYVNCRNAQHVTLIREETLLFCEKLKMHLTWQNNACNYLIVDYYLSIGFYS